MSEVVEDRISNLPGSILHHILSFVDTCDAARTSVLSKRWKYIWRSIPVLHFRFQDSSQTDKFVDFVDTTLERHDESNIQKFILYCDVPLSEPQIKKWILTVISHSVEVFDLQLNQRRPIYMPSSLYTCESLVSLRIFLSPNMICFPKYVSYPRLERMILAGVEFRDECWNEELFSSSPVLQILLMAYCTWPGMKNFCISNPALKELIIINPKEDEDDFRNCALEICTPMLEELTYIGRVAKDYVLSGFPTLNKAFIDLFFGEYDATWEEQMDFGAVVSKFLRALAHVIHLSISDRTLQVLSVVDDLLNNLPSYNNLKELCLTQEVTADKALIALLERAPNLVSLEFERCAPPSDVEEEDDDYNSGDDGDENNHFYDAAEGEDNNDNEDDSWALGVLATRCFFLHLKLVNFKKFTGNTREMKWLKLILKSAKALEEMDISFGSISHGKSKKLVADIPSLPRVSASCMFKFSSNQG